MEDTSGALCLARLARAPAPRSVQIRFGVTICSGISAIKLLFSLREPSRSCLLTHSEGAPLYPIFHIYVLFFFGITLEELVLFALDPVWPVRRL